MKQLVWPFSSRFSLPLLSSQQLPCLLGLSRSLAQPSLILDIDTLSPDPFECFLFKQFLFVRVEKCGSAMHGTQK